MKDFTRLWKSSNQECYTNLGSRRKVVFSKKNLYLVEKLILYFLSQKMEICCSITNRNISRCGKETYYSFGDLCNLYRGGKTIISKLEKVNIFISAIISIIIQKNTCTSKICVVYFCPNCINFCLKMLIFSWGKLQPYRA